MLKLCDETRTRIVWFLGILQTEVSTTVKYLLMIKELTVRFSEPRIVVLRKYLVVRGCIYLVFVDLFTADGLTTCSTSGSWSIAEANGEFTLIARIWTQSFPPSVGLHASVKQLWTPLSRRRSVTQQRKRVVHTFSPSKCCQTIARNVREDIPAAQSWNNELTEGMSRIRVVVAWFYARSASESQSKLGYLPVVDCRAFMDVP